MDRRTEGHTHTHTHTDRPTAITLRCACAQARVNNKKNSKTKQKKVRLIHQWKMGYGKATKKVFHRVCSVGGVQSGMIDCGDSIRPQVCLYTTMGMKSTPAKRQAGRLDFSFCRTPKLMACITLTSRPAGLPWPQFRRRISAGRELELELGTRLDASIVGARAATERAHPLQ